MSEGEIEEIVAAHARAARRAQAAGFDGIEIMAAYNALMEQFWSPFSNRRGDRWGGGFEGRMAYSDAVFSAIRRACGEDFIIGVCVSVDETRPDVLSLEDQCEIAAWHDARGLIDYVTVGTGGYFDFTALIPTVLHPAPFGPQYAEKIRAAVTHARVQAESHIRTPDIADYVVASGQADMVSIVRGQIADPHLANKAREGRAEDARPCISCSQMCWGRRSRDYWISCLVNPSAGREFEWGGDRFTPAETPKRVLVVGGGPAGLEAARAAAERGHRVTLAEASNVLGGQFRLAGLQPRRQQILDLIEWYERQLTKLQVSVRLNAYLDADDIVAEAADHVILAAGSLPEGTGRQRWVRDMEAIPGADRANVWSVEEVMRREARLPDAARVVMMDDMGDWRGLGTAWSLAERGSTVTIVTPDAYPGREMTRTASDLPLRARLAKLGAQFETESAVVEWTGAAAKIRSLLTGETREAAFDALILSCLNTVDETLPTALAAQGVPVIRIGDALAPRHAPAAIFEGRRAALGI